MIFDEIVLHNFRAYRGEHAIKLTPQSSKKPIVLIGGYNGAGKTTLFDAFQLVLFGKQANGSSRENLPYDTYLKQSINKQTPHREGARISLIFRHSSNGSENKYKVSRFWNSNGKGVREKVEVRLNGELDKVLSETWGEIVEDFIPIEISKLFFFDGEKIKELAEKQKTAQIISTGIYSLLGLNLIDKLHTDLGVLKKRKSIPMKANIEKSKINEIQEAVNKYEGQRSKTKTIMTVVGNELKDLEKSLQKQERQFKKAGGNFYTERSELEKEKAFILSKLEENGLRLRELAATALPLSLVSPLLKQVQKQGDKEFESHRNKLVLDILEKQNSKLIKYLKEQDSSDMTVSAVNDFLQQERNEIQKDSEAESYLNMSETARINLNQLLDYILPDLTDRRQRLAQEHDDLQTRLSDVDRQLQMVPEQESIVKFILDIERTRADLEKKRNEYRIAEERYKMAVNNHESELNQLERAISKAIEEKFKNESNRRIVQYSSKVQDTILKYKKAMVRCHVDRIQNQIMESISELFRKRNFIKNFVINPEDFSFTLYDKKDEIIQLQQLSAGEKQLVVTSILWGLAKSSNFPLPSIIDTPLGRLDSKHRQKIIKGYFPQASHQVILLSTDEEISDKYLNQLKSKISHSYILKYNDENESTTLESGYFKKVS
ncbi:DNA sulfur modification protein DndD [Desulfospira joergensenii]|uniref:DNA sulfur modification protein DndD n=1 Tax=Desulfospira joergensenii TaxID=53329 RepID=UPI0003B63820|nr:DNA sulfur modification protein DndD [Desulfospira joergensenii]